MACMKKGFSIMLCAGPYGGFRCGINRHTFRVCLGWVALTITRVDVDLYLTDHFVEQHAAENLALSAGQLSRVVLNQSEMDRLRRGLCPDCASKNMRLGPPNRDGGTSTLCLNCGMEFNFVPGMVQLSTRICQASRERRRTAYGLKE